jgi:alkanesulfonate monooxygenase SsuD/methylene tetrahydromethanopterin reductase-like flavin-dependent oxidoreductase (luciferase family)
MLAKAAASLSVLIGDRIVLGVGGGATAGGIEAMGETGREGSEMVAFTRESLLIMRRALGGGIVDLPGSQLSVDYQAGPLPVAPIPIWLGSAKPKMLELTGRSSDGWVTPLSTYQPPSSVPAAQKLIDEAARSAGRDPADVRRIYNVVGAIGPARGGPGLTGDVETWIDTLTDWSVDLGLDTFIFWPMTSPQAQLEVFAAEVVPGVRERVGQRRSTTVGSTTAR